MMASLGAPATGEMRPSIRRGGWCRGCYDQHAPTIWLLPSTGRWNNVVRYWPGPPLRWRWPNYTYDILHANVRELVPIENRLVSASPT